MPTIPINVVKNDKLYDINFTLQNNDGTAFDLTGNSGIFLKVQKQGATAVKFSGSCTVVGAATAGTCKYNVAATDFDDVGTYYAEIEVTFAGGKVITFPDIVITVKPELPRT